MKVLLVVNSSASSASARSRVVISKALAADHDLAVAETSRRGHATRLAQGAARDGVDVVAVLGGDGTLNEAANGLAGSDTALAALPGGSTNVFARTIGMPDDAVEATGVLLSSLESRSVRRIGLGSVEGRYFLFHVGMGFDAAVVEQVEKRSTMKRWASHPLFVYCAFDTWFRHYDRRRPRFSVTRPGTETVHDAYMALCLNSNPYTYLGSRPLDIAPEATLERPLTMVTIRTMSFVPIMGLAARALIGNKKGTNLASSRWLDYAPDVSEVVVRSERPFPYQVDGDYLGEVTGLSFTHEPEMLDIVVPWSGPTY